MFAIVAALSAPAIAFARPTREPGDGVPDTIKYYETVSMQSSATTSATDNGLGTADVSFFTLGREFDLKLEAHAPFAPGATVQWVDDTGTVYEPANTGIHYRGRVEGDPNSWVRISMRHDGLAGVISTDGELYFLEPAARFFGDDVPAETLAYRLSDTEPDDIPATCAAEELSPRAQRRLKRLQMRDQRRTAAQMLRRVLGSAATTSAVEQANQLRHAELGMVADFEYFSKHGAGSADDIAEIVNAVDGIYQSEIGVTVELVTTVVYTTSTDPFSGATDPNTILTEFNTWRNANDNNASQPLWGTDYAHLITGRDLDSTVIGIAYVGAVCGSSASGVDQDFSTSLNLMTLLLAHEMGHNFGSSHDGANGCTSGTYIMSPAISNSLLQQFSSCSKTSIGGFLAGNNSSCMELVDPTPTPTPVPLTLNPIPSPIVVGGTLTLTGTGFNSGSVINLFVNINGPVAYGPFRPSSFTSTTLTFAPLDPTVPLGNGFATVQVINTTQNFITSNVQSQYLYGKNTMNIPTITGLNGKSLRPLDPSVPLASVETAVQQDSTLTINGTGFNSPLVNLYTANGYVGPITPLSGGTATQIRIVVPASAATGPLSIQVVNSPYTGNVISNAVSAALGAPVSITGTSQSGTTVTVHGSGFSALTVINFWAKNNQGSTNFYGGYSSPGVPRIPLTLISDTEFRFTLPSGVAGGMAYVQVVNPPFIPFSTSGADPDGALFLSL